jgi:hypothetical protein
MGADAAGPSSGWACHGFEVRSELPFRLLRRGDGRLLEILEHDGWEPDSFGDPVMTWEARPGNPFARRIYEQDDGYAVWHEAIGWFYVDPRQPRITVPPTADEFRREERTWGLPAALCISEGDDVALHASAVEVEGSALLFCAPGHHGKTTLGAAFIQAGYRLLADDLSCCGLGPEPIVRPGPAVIRIRRDVHASLRFPGTERIAEDDDKVHLMLAPDGRGSGAPVPIRGIVFVRSPWLKASEGRPAIYPISTQEALPNMWTVSFALPTADARGRMFPKITALAGGVSLWEMYRPQAFDDLPDAVELIRSTCLAEP